MSRWGNRVRDVGGLLKLTVSKQPSLIWNQQGSVFPSSGTWNKPTSCHLRPLNGSSLLLIHSCLPHQRRTNLLSSFYESRLYHLIVLFISSWDRHYLFLKNQDSGAWECQKISLMAYDKYVIQETNNSANNLICSWPGGHRAEEQETPDSHTGWSRVTWNRSFSFGLSAQTAPRWSNINAFRFYPIIWYAQSFF